MPSFENFRSTQASLQNNTKLVISDQSKLINVLGLGTAERSPDEQTAAQNKIAADYP
jgi:hypothetical protein